MLPCTLLLGSVTPFAVGATVNGAVSNFSPGVYMRKAKHLLSTAIIVVLSLNALAFASYAAVLTFNEATGGSGANQNQSVGWQFNVLSPITVGDLEWYDPTRNGLSTQHMVGIWNSGGTLLTSALIPAGAVAGLDGMFRFVLVTPITLAVGNGYIVGGENFSTNTDRLACGSGGSCDGLLSQTLDPRLAFVNATFSDIGSGFVAPTQFSVAHEGFYGPSFSAAAVPEPSSMLLLVTAVLGVLISYRTISLRSRTKVS